MHVAKVKIIEDSFGLLFLEERDSIQDIRRSGRRHVDNHTIELLRSLLYVESRWTARELQ